MKDIDLDYPIPGDGGTIKQLTMRRCKVRDQKVAGRTGKTDEERETILFANLCSVKPDVIDELDMVDYQKLQETYNSFLSPAQQKSEPPSE